MKKSGERHREVEKSKKNKQTNKQSNSNRRKEFDTHKKKKKMKTITISSAAIKIWMERKQEKLQIDTAYGLWLHDLFENIFAIALLFVSSVQFDAHIVLQ